MSRAESKRSHGDSGRNGDSIGFSISKRSKNGGRAFGREFRSAKELREYKRRESRRLERALLPENIARRNRGVHYHDSGEGIHAGLSASEFQTQSRNRDLIKRGIALDLGYRSERESGMVADQNKRQGIEARIKSQVLQAIGLNLVTIEELENHESPIVQGVIKELKGGLY